MFPRNLTNFKKHLIIYPPPNKTSDDLFHFTLDKSVLGCSRVNINIFQVNHWTSRSFTIHWILVVSNFPGASDKALPVESAHRAIFSSGKTQSSGQASVRPLQQNLCDGTVLKNMESHQKLPSTWRERLWYWVMKRGGPLMNRYSE